MSRNRSRLSKAKSNKDYTILIKNEHVRCYYCMKTTGSYNGSCSAIRYRGRTVSWRFRMYRNWKNNRKTQYKNG